VAGQQVHGVTKAQIKRTTIRANKRAVFVTSEFKDEVIPSDNLRRPGVAACSFPAHINNDALRHWPADHAAEDRQGRAKRRESIQNRGVLMELG
jgi:hypothetical protein